MGKVKQVIILTVLVTVISNFLHSFLHPHFFIRVCKDTLNRNIKHFRKSILFDLLRNRYHWLTILGIKTSVIAKRTSSLPPFPISIRTGKSRINRKFLHPFLEQRLKKRRIIIISFLALHPSKIA